MQLHNIISSPNSSVWRQLSRFRKTIEQNEIWRPVDDVLFVFLCGANIKSNAPSKRRKDLLEFSLKNLPHAKFFLAESIFKILEEEGNKGNLLDIENDLSVFSDFVIVVLESESSFCELGAFATHQDLRKKLIVINDINHQNSTSFINLGPIQAIKEISSGKNILYYKMEQDGKFRGDGIGEIFHKLHKLIHKTPKKRRTRVLKYNPNENFTKDSIRFVHDLIFISIPISLAELSRVLKVLFNVSNDKQLQKHLGLLCATEQIERTKNSFYKSLSDDTFFEYELNDITNIIASFKNLYFRYDKKRLS